MDSSGESPQDPSSSERAVAALAEPYIAEPPLCEVRPRRAPGLLRRGGRNHPDHWHMIAVATAGAFFAALGPLGVARALAPYFTYAHVLPWLALPLACWVVFFLIVGVVADPALRLYTHGTPQPALVMTTIWRPLQEGDPDPTHYEAVVMTLTRDPRTGLIEPRGFNSRPVSADLLERTTVTVRMWDRVTVLYLDEDGGRFTLYGLTELDPSVRFVHTASAAPWIKWLVIDIFGTAFVGALVLVIPLLRMPLVLREPGFMVPMIVTGLVIASIDFLARRRGDRVRRERRERVKRSMLTGGGPLLPERRERPRRPGLRVLSGFLTGFIGAWILLVGLNSVGDLSPPKSILVEVEDVRESTTLAVHRFTLRFKDPETEKVRTTPLTYEEFQAIGKAPRVELKVMRGLFGWRWVQKVNPAH